MLKKKKQIIVNETNKNDVIKLLGPPSTQVLLIMIFWVYIERKTTDK